MRNSCCAVLVTWTVNNHPKQHIKFVTGKRSGITKVKMGSSDSCSSIFQALNKEISAKQTQLITLTQASDNISQGLAMEGGTTLKGRVTEMKAKVSKLAEDVRQRLNALSDTILARSVTHSQCICAPRFTYIISRSELISGEI
jgi:hypothetical protein